MASSVACQPWMSLLPHHFENVELVIAKRQGRCRWNYLNVVPVQNIYERWISQYAAPSAALLLRISADLDG